MSFNYVPVLKAKDGELIALRNLAPAIKAGLMPLIELQPKKSSKLLERNLGQIKKGWGQELPLLLDVDKDYLVKDASSATQNMRDSIGELTQSGFTVIPVTGLGRPTIFNGLISDILGDTPNGICIRLRSSDWQDISSLASRLKKSIQGFSLDFDQVDLVFDYEAFLPSSLGTIITSAVAAINSVSNVDRYRNLIITATAFPSQLSSQPHTIYHFPRSEYEAWSILASNPKLKRKPIFGDYTTIHPVFPDIDFTKGIKVAPKIKYATDSEWIFLRWDAGDFEDFYEVCKSLIKLSEFSGADYSWGDNRVAQCAATGSRTGNPREWVSIGVNHHLALVAEQCANHPDA